MICAKCGSDSWKWTRRTGDRNVADVVCQDCGYEWEDRNPDHDPGEDAWRGRRRKGARPQNPPADADDFSGGRDTVEVDLRTAAELRELAEASGRNVGEVVRGLLGEQRPTWKGQSSAEDKVRVCRLGRFRLRVSSESWSVDGSAYVAGVATDVDDAKRRCVEAARKVGLRVR